MVSIPFVLFIHARGLSQPRCYWASFFRGFIWALCVCFFFQSGKYLPWFFDKVYPIERISNFRIKTRVALICRGQLGVSLSTPHPFTLKCDQSLERVMRAWVWGFRGQHGSVWFAVILSLHSSGEETRNPSWIGSAPPSFVPPNSTPSFSLSALTFTNKWVIHPPFPPSPFSLCLSFDLICHPRFWRQSAISYLLPSFSTLTHAFPPGLRRSFFFTCLTHDNTRWPLHSPHLRLPFTARGY